MSFVKVSLRELLAKTKVNSIQLYPTWGNLVGAAHTYTKRIQMGTVMDRETVKVKI